MRDMHDWEYAIDLKRQWNRCDSAMFLNEGKGLSERKPVVDLPHTPDTGLLIVSRSLRSSEHEFVISFKRSYRDLPLAWQA